MLQQKGLETVQVRLAAAMEAPEETVIVLMGDLREAERISQGLARFVQDGGALLVATDLGGGTSRQSRRLRWLFGTEFRYSDMRFAGHDQLASKYSDCPLVTDLDRSPEPDLFAGVQSIAANRPGYLQTSNQVHGIAWLPQSTPNGQDPVALMGSRRVGKGRMLLVADHSVFINEMLIHADNARFASNVTHWLTADGNRKQVVICLDNNLLPEWSFVGTPPTIPLKDLLRSVQRHGLAGLPTGEALLPMLNQSLVDFERQGGFNHFVRKLAGSSRMRGSPNLQRPLIILAVLLLLVALRWLLLTRARAQPWFFTQEDMRIGETRLSAAAREQNQLPVLRALVREFFAEAGVTRFSEPGKYPDVSWQTPVRSPKNKAADVRALWDIATTAPRGRISRKKIKALTEQLRRVYQLHARGLLKVQ